MNTDEAVEAAARELAACYGVVDFDRLDDYEKGFWLDPVKKLMASAWDEGVDWATNGSAGSRQFSYNPYRSGA